MCYNNWLIYSNAEIIALTGQTTKTSTITLTLTAVGNTNASITSTPVTTATEGTLYTYNVTATDLDGDYLNFYDNTTLFDINPTTGLISFTPGTDTEAGNHTIEIYVFDFQGGFASQVYNLSITAVNDAPVLNFIGIITLQENLTMLYTATATDEETLISNLTFNVSGVSFANISENNIINFSPKVGDDGTYTINVTVSDGSAIDSENVTIYVLDIVDENNAPAILSFTPADLTPTIKADSNQTFNITYSDEDGNNTVSVQWFLNSLEVSGENNNSYTFIGNYTDAGSNAGMHTVRVDVSDGLTTASNYWTLYVNITRDADGDGIPDYLDSCPFFSGTCDSTNLDADNVTDAVDFLLGNVTFIDKNIPLDFEVNGSTDLNKIFNETLPVKFVTQIVINDTLYDQPTVEFDFGFNNETKLNLNDITIKQYDTNNTGSFLVAGINLMPQNLTKSVHFKRVNASINGVCIKDEIISSVNEMTSACNGTAETQVECDGTNQSGYTCTLNTTTNYYRIQGLNHSGGKQIDYTKPAAPAEEAEEEEEEAAAAPSAGTAGGGAGGGGGGAVGAGAIPSVEIEAEKSGLWADVEEGSQILMSIDEPKIPITRITLSANTHIKILEIGVKSLKGKPVQASAAAKVYQYLQITQKNTQNKQISNINIEFKVAKIWLNENSIKSEDVSLFRYKNNVWNRLLTIVTGTDTDYVYYKATSPEFSYFAIGAGIVEDYLSGIFIEQLPIAVDSELIKAVLKEGETTTRTFTITNEGNKALQLRLEVEGLEDFVILSDYTLIMNPGEEKVITADITSPEVIDIYHGKILIQADSKIKSVALLIETKSKTSTLDVLVRVPKSYKKIKKGEEITGVIDLIYLGEVRPIAIKLLYAIKDLDGKILSFKEETLEVNDGLLVDRSLKVPKNAEEREYIFYVKASYNGNIAISSDFFEVSRESWTLSMLKNEDLFEKLLFILALLLATLTVLNLMVYKEIKFVAIAYSVLSIIKLRAQETIKRVLLRKKVDYFFEEKMKNQKICFPPRVLFGYLLNAFKKKSKEEKEFKDLKKQISSLHNIFEKAPRTNILKIKSFILRFLQIFLRTKKKKGKDIWVNKKKFTERRLYKELDIIRADFEQGIITKDIYDKQKKKISGLIKKELDRQLQILEADLEDKIITKDTYVKEKKKIEGLIKKKNRKIWRLKRKEINPLLKK